MANESDYYIHPAVNERLEFNPQLRAAIAKYPELLETFASLDPITKKLVIGGQFVGGGEGSGDTGNVAAIQRIVDASTLTANTGGKSIVLAGVISAAQTGGWGLIPSTTSGGNRSINFDGVQTIVDVFGGDDSYLRVNYDDVAANRITTFIAVPEVSLVKAGITVGVNANTRSAELRFRQTSPVVADYVYFDVANNKWVSSNGSFTPTFSGGYLTLTHTKAVPLQAKDSVAITPRSPSIYAGISQLSTPNNETKLTLELRDNSPTLSTYVQFEPSLNAFSSKSTDFNNPVWSSGTLYVNHIDLAADDADQVALTSRGLYDARITQKSSPLLKNRVGIEFFKQDGSQVTTPDVNMKVYIQRGGTSHALVTQPRGDMKFFVQHGGGDWDVSPQDITVAKFGGTKIYLFGIVEKNLV